MRKNDGELIFNTSYSTFTSREYVLTREIFREFFKKPRPIALNIPDERGKRGEIERADREKRHYAGLQKGQVTSKCLFGSRELSKGALCRCRVEEECLKRLYMRIALVKGLRGIGLRAESNMTFRDSGILIYGGARFLQPKNRNAHLFQDESHRVLPERREDLPYKSRLIAGVKMEKHEGSFILRIKIATFGVGKKYARECTK